MAEVCVIDVAALGDTGRKVVEVSGMEVGIFRLGEEFFAYENKCPHLEGPVCQGKILPLAVEDIQADGSSNGRVFSKSKMNVVCPWHGFEFDIRTGIHPMDSRVRLRKVPLKVIDGAIYLSVGK
jgi:nitrite reductase/ring-hydroxylating ferredoxin subunit